MALRYIPDEEIKCAHNFWLQSNMEQLHARAAEVTHLPTDLVCRNPAGMLDLLSVMANGISHKALPSCNPHSSLAINLSVSSSFRVFYSWGCYASVGYEQWGTSSCERQVSFLTGSKVCCLQ